MKQTLLLLLFFAVSFSAKSQDSSEYIVLFELDQSKISSEQEELLTEWLLTISDTVKRVEVIGHTDFLGSKAYNLALSEKRAQNVNSTLEKANEFNYRMSLISAVGEEKSVPNGSANGIVSDRKVEVKLFFAKPKKTLTPEVKVEEPQESKSQPDTDLLEQASVGQTIVLKNLNFYPGRHFLIPQALSELERLIQIMNRNPTMEIEIQGHICCKLDSIDAMDVNTRTYSLSFNRAEYIFQQLALAGIEEKRMKYRGFAGSRPLIEPELTTEDRNRNRRVEIKVLKK